MKSTIAALPALLVLAACDGDIPESGLADDQAVISDSTPLATASVPTAAPASDEAATPITSIPQPIQGRWGLTAADCEPGRGDATGLLVITGGKLEFYESVGTLTEIEEAEAGRIRAAFDFTGEGMTWERDLVLDVQDQGQTLIRREYGQDAAPGPFRYVKCS